MSVLFRHGQMVGTPAALQLLADHGTSIIDLLNRHLSGDWGDCCPEDKRANDRAVNDGGRIFTVFVIGGEKVYLITEAEDDNGVRQSTCLLLADEY